MAKEMDVLARLVRGMQFEVDSSTGHSITLDASVEDGGQDTGFRPIELLLVGLAGCTGMDVISILRKKRQNVTGYEVRVHGVRVDTHPKVFVDITVEHIVTGHHVQPKAVARAIELSETRYCPVGAMLNKTARVTNTFRIIDAAQLPM